MLRVFPGGADGTRARGLRRDRPTSDTLKKPSEMDVPGSRRESGSVELGQGEGVGPKRGHLATPLLLNGHHDETEGPTRLLSVRQVADLLGLCTKTIYELVARGVLPHVRILNTIRFRPDDLKEYI